jgi:uncharacterized protein YecT (DUF1311 family)
MFNYATAAKSVGQCKTDNQNISPSDVSRCLDGVIEQVDRELQTWVNLHTFNLEEKALVNGRQSTLKMFKRAQNDFVTYRENDCRWQYLALSPDRRASLAYKTCYVLLSEKRIKALSVINTNNASL